MTGWIRIPMNGYFGIVIYTFLSEEDEKLRVSVGESLHLLQEEEHWYYGYTTKDCSTKGIIPKSYVKIIDCDIDNTDTTPNFNIKNQPSIVYETTQVLREWGTLWKKIYVANREQFEEIKMLIYELIKRRSKITSGTLPLDELRQVTKQITEDIANGNKKLGLDLVVRDEQHSIINPDGISTVQLYNYHLNAAEQLSKRKSDSKTQTVSVLQQYSHIFIVSVKNFTCKMTEDAELIMFLYDAKLYRAITESYVVRWSKDGLMSDLDQINNLRVMFTDLGKKDVERERIYLVCNVIRVGTMESKEVLHRRSSVSIVNKKSSDAMRRPFGVAAKDITHFMSGKIESDMEQEYTVPFYNCDKDNLEQILKKIINKEEYRNESKNQSLFISLKLLHGDLKQENPHLVLGNVSIARKMGFPEVILPGDVRNDLYLTLIGGEFPKGNKTSDKNVEVLVLVCNKEGVPIPGVISMGMECINEYRSIIYYHEDKPQWHETFKVAITIEEFELSHIKFFFKHRSSNEAKDKSEKPFAMAYVKLLQSNGTMLKDGNHSLLVYKIDHKKFDDKSIEYLNLPTSLVDKEVNKSVVNGLTFSSKDMFSISSNICSTKLTQNVNLLGLLNWSTHKHTLQDSLENLMAVEGEEIVKFLQDILDALFNILMKNPDNTEYDFKIFKCLLHVISIVSNDWKYQHFEPVLDLYIKDGAFSATLAYIKLMTVLQDLIDNPCTKNNQQLVFKTMKSLQYIMRFISKSRLLFIELEESNTYQFEDSMDSLLHSFVNLMYQSSDKLLREQGACLKYLPSTIPDIIKVFNPKRLSEIFSKLLEDMPQNRLTKQKIMTMNEIVHSQLFLYPDCREVLMPIFTRQIKILFEINEEGKSSGIQQGRRINKQSVAKVARVLGETRQCINQHTGYSEEVNNYHTQQVELCIKILGDILDLLFTRDSSTTSFDINEIIVTDLRTITQTYIKMDKESPHAKHLVAIMIDIFRQMNTSHYENYIKTFRTRTDILDFLMEILMIFKELVNQSIFPADWCGMIMLQNHVILKALRFFSHTIRDNFFEKFEQQAWSNFFHCAIAFMTQPALQLETFTNDKRMRIVKKYSDMRRETGFEIRSMWFNLGQYKRKFVPTLVQSILEMTLIPETELRKATIPIFFDMMQCEFYSSRIEFESFGDTKRESKNIKGNFYDFENEIISKLDTLVEGGRGDENYKILFHDIMMDHCINHSTLKEDGIKFVNTVTRLMERLLQYRCIMDEENKENMMICIVNLLDFYSEINRKEMYIRYVNKLCDLHLECENYTEAAYTLELHSKLLQWSDDILPPLLKSNRYTECHTHRQLKQALYYNIIEYYSKGKMYECALTKCKELAKQFEDETFDYEQLSELHQRMSFYYDNIIKSVRMEPEYFRVAYYGGGFPKFLQNKVFIYRGKEYERLAEFSSRTLNEFPKAELLKQLTPPKDDIKESNGQYLQINKVDPIMDTNKRFTEISGISDQIVKYYKVNHIDKFQYSRPFIRKESHIQNSNEFANLWLERTVLTTYYSLPGTLRWFAVKKTETYEISPLLNAIETMENANKELRNLFLLYNKDKLMQVNSLSLKLTGILDPAVMGGIMNYETAFFNNAYSDSNNYDSVLIDKLKSLIADQIPVLDLCVQIHKERAPPSLQPLQLRLEDCFLKMQASVYEKYGKRTCEDLKLESAVILRRCYTNSDSRSLDITNATDSLGARSRVSSVTRAQVTSFKSLTSSFNFTSPQISTRNTSPATKIQLRSPSKSFSSTTLSNNKTKEKTKSNKTDSISSANTSSQWYAVDEDVSVVNAQTAQIVELREELSSSRPLRSQVEREKRLSRPSSGQFSRQSSIAMTQKPGSSSGTSSNRDSVGTNDSSVSEEDLQPPPLPIKLREADYCNIFPGNTSSRHTSIEHISFIHSMYKMQENLKTKVSESPPVPPPKPLKSKSIPRL